MRTRVVMTLLAIMTVSMAWAVGGDEYYQYSVDLKNYISKETGKAPTAHLWVAEGCKKVTAVVFAQQNMTEEAILKHPSFRRQMADIGVALLWVEPWFSQSWNPESGCQDIFEEMMTDIAFQANHPEVAKAPMIPLGHSAQATFPWNFAAWNADRTLCIVSFHGDAPRTNLCGYGGANIEWGRTRNIDGIPGLMIEGEYEWWEARVTPALAFRMMYPGSCISFLCDTGRGHFDCDNRTVDYMAMFIRKSMEKRLCADGTLAKLDPNDGVFVERYRADMPQNEATDKGTMSRWQQSKATVDPHDCFWYIDEEMATLTRKIHAESHGKKMQYMGVESHGRLVAPNPKVQCGMEAAFEPEADGVTIKIRAVYTDSTHTALTKAHSRKPPRMEVISGPIRKISDDTFRIYPYEAGFDNPRRSFTCLLVAIGDADENYRGAVQPVMIRYSLEK